jgi:U6 snRNA-associated Sm-like protein LSm7
MSRSDSLDLAQNIDKPVRVKFQGGREVTGILKGYDQLANIVLDMSVESLRDESDPYTLTGETRDLGLVVCKGKSVMCIMPDDGMEEIENPFR